MQRKCKDKRNLFKNENHSRLKPVKQEVGDMRLKK